MFGGGGSICEVRILCFFGVGEGCCFLGKGSRF